MDLVSYFLLYFYAFWMGGAVTTFYNRIIHNLPIGYNQKPRCNFCHNQIKFPYFIPIVGFILSRGICKNCRHKISYEYLLLELLVAFLVILITQKYSIYTDQFLVSSFLVIFLVLSSAIYLKKNFFPKDIIFVGIIIMLISVFYSQGAKLQDLISFSFLRIITVILLDKKRNIFNSSEKAFLMLLGITNNFIQNIIFAIFMICFYYLLNHLRYFQMYNKKVYLILFTVLFSYFSIFINYGF